jgi:heme-degrading monooxygenase HmoA
MIERHWGGTARAERADGYLRHLEGETFPHLRTLPGFVRARVLRRDVPDGVEFRVVTTWESLDVIRAFAGDDVDVAVVPEVVRGMMVRFDPRVAHYEIVEGCDRRGAR